MRILLTGASGQLGAYLIDRIRENGHDLIAWGGSSAGERGGVALRPVELADADTTERALAEVDPEVILHAAAVSSAEAVRLDPDRARAVNVEATGRLAAWCVRSGRRLVFTSTDLVFDGSKPWNRENDPAEPILAYGRTKRAAEPTVLAVPEGLVARISLLFGPSRCGRPSFFDGAIAALCRGEPRAFFVDEFRTPLHLADAAALLVALIESGVSGLVHVGGAERMSRFELMRRAAIALGIDPGLVRADRREDTGLAEPRPADVSLDTTRLSELLPGAGRASVEESIVSET